MRAAPFLLASVLLMGVAGSARAGDPTPGEIQAARDLFAKAEAEEDAGHWAAALEKLRRAGSVKMTPGIRYHIALCEEKLGQLVAALSDYTGADQAARAEKNREVQDAVAEPLRALRVRVPTLTINVPEASGAELLLDGKPVPVGLWGIATPVEPGQAHAIEARAPGKQTFAVQVTLKERDAQTVDVRWTEAPKTGPAPSGGDVKPPPGTGDGKPPPRNVQPPGDAASPPPGENTTTRSRAPAVVATVAAVGFLGFGVGAFFLGGSEQDDLRVQCAALPPAQCDALKGPTRTWDALSLTGFIAGGALAIVAVVLWAQPSKTSKSEAALVMGPGSIGVRGSF
jgi:hypothetical protein